MDISGLDRVVRDWRWGENPPRAVAGANRILDAILAEDLPMSVKLALLEAAIEPMLDAEGGSPARVYQVTNAVAKESTYHEATERLSYETRMARRMRITVARARAAHCMGRSDLAFRQCLGAHAAIETMADGRDQLLATLGNQQPNLTAELMDGVLGILAASMRRALSADHPSRQYWTNEIRDIAASFMPGLNAEKAQVYPGSGSRVQAMYVLTERGDPRDARLISALRAFDMRARLTDPRAQATIPLREVAYAKFVGDAVTMEEQAALAIVRLGAHPMPRHLRRVGEDGLLD